MSIALINGTAIERHGPADAPPVFLIHGLGLNRECWQWTVPALLDAGFHVITYDLYGHGQSRAPAGTPSLVMFSQQLTEILDALDIQQAAITGFSLGGMIARRFAQDHPDRTSAVAILNSPHKRTPEAQRKILDRVTQARSEGPAATVEAALERWFTAPYRAANPEIMDLVCGWVLANDKAVYHRIYRVLADGIDEIVAPTPPISCPALVLTGDEDFGNGPEMSAAIAAEIDGARLHVLNGLRHMALAEDPEAVNEPLIGVLREALAMRMPA